MDVVLRREFDDSATDEDVVGVSDLRTVCQRRQPVRRFHWNIVRLYVRLDVRFDKVRLDGSASPSSAALHNVAQPQNEDDAPSDDEGGHQHVRFGLGPRGVHDDQQPEDQVSEMLRQKDT